METATHADEMRAVRDRFFASVTSGDVEAVRACYAPDALIWHNTDGLSQTVDENLRVLGWIAQNVRHFRYENVRFEPTPAGFVEQHMTCGVSPSGVPFAIPACIVCAISDGLVTRLDEYLDSKQTEAIAR